MFCTKTKESDACKNHIYSHDNNAYFCWVEVSTQSVGLISFVTAFKPLSAVVLYPIKVTLTISTWKKGGGCG